MGRDKHIVQFYDTANFLHAAVTDFLMAAPHGTPGLVIATDAHRIGIVEALSTRQRAEPGRLIGPLFMLDARETLSRFMREGSPEAALFHAEMGKLLRDVEASSSSGRVHVFGEMVDLLWRDGNHAGALRLEALWNELLAQRDVSLLCGYPMAHFERQSATSAFRAVCSLHTCARATERFLKASDVDSACGGLAILQQYMRALERELDEAGKGQRPAPAGGTSRVVVAAHNQLMRAALAALLEREAELEVIGAVASHVGDVLAACQMRPDLLLLEGFAYDQQTLEVLTALRARAPDTRCVVLSNASDSAHLRSALQAGADGYVLTASTPEALMRAIHAALEGRLFVDVEGPREAHEPGNVDPPPSVLSTREREVLSLLALGNTNKEIAERLSISIKTVETHRQKVTNKLGRRSRTDLVHYATRAGLVQLRVDDEVY